MEIFAILSFKQDQKLAEKMSLLWDYVKFFWNLLCDKRQQTKKGKEEENLDNPEKDRVISSCFLWNFISIFQDSAGCT